MASTRSAPTSPSARRGRGRPSIDPGRRSTGSGLLCGLGLIAFVDETVFHQLLHWHHFYDRSTPAAGLVSDGLFHAFGFVAVVAGLFVFADLRRRDALSTSRWIGGVLLGAGVFQLYDGLVQHKLLGLHQIRYDVTLLPYDLAWNAAAGVLIVLGTAVLLRARRTRARAAVKRGGGETGHPR